MTKDTEDIYDPYRFMAEPGSKYHPTHPDYDLDTKRPKRFEAKRYTIEIHLDTDGNLVWEAVEKMSQSLNCHNVDIAKCTFSGEVGHEMNDDPKATIIYKIQARIDDLLPGVHDAVLAQARVQVVEDGGKPVFKTRNFDQISLP